MRWANMLVCMLRLTWPYLLTPWRSPLLRWRMETYGVMGQQGHMLHADDITPVAFCRFTLRHRVPLRRFLRWAVDL